MLLYSFGTCSANFGMPSAFFPLDFHFSSGRSVKMHHLCSGIICLIVANSFVFFELALSRGMGGRFVWLDACWSLCWLDAEESILEVCVNWMIVEVFHFFSTHLTHERRKCHFRHFVCFRCSDLLLNFEKKCGWNVLHYYWIVLRTVWSFQRSFFATIISYKRNFHFDERKNLDLLLFVDKNTWSWSFTFLVLFQKQQILIFEL